MTLNFEIVLRDCNFVQGGFFLEKKKKIITREQHCFRVTNRKIRISKRLERRIDRSLTQRDSKIATYRFEKIIITRRMNEQAIIWVKGRGSRGRETRVHPCLWEETKSSGWTVKGKETEEGEAPSNQKNRNIPIFAEIR